LFTVFLLFGEEMGLLISVPSASLSAGLALSLLAAVGVCGVSPVQLIPQDIEQLPRIRPRTMEMR
jgi:hypothetical protein